MIIKGSILIAKGPSLITKLDPPGQDPSVSLAINRDST